jgi:ubiquinone/menaquinone biosynthesis C-methylase UbiE
MTSSQATATFEKYQASPPLIYERHFVPSIGAPVAGLLIDAAGLRPGQRVLDVACGTGVVARLAAEQVGPAGTVAGVDLNGGMLAVARSVVPAGTTIDWYEAAAENLPLADASFDAVLCSLGLQFFADRARALRETRRVLAPGGRVVLGTPGPTPSPFAALRDSLAEHVGADAARFVQAVFSLYDPATMRDLLAAAGFGDAEVSTSTLSLRLAEPAEFLWQYVQGTPLSAAVARAGHQARVALQRDVLQRWEPFIDDNALVVDIGMLLATARREEER